jgi:hypothetical protein
MNVDVPGWISERDLNVLSHISSHVPENGNILEVGPFLGRSTSALLYGKKDSVALDVVDTFTGIPVNSECRGIRGNKETFNRLQSLAQKTGDWEESFKKSQENNLKNMNIFKCSSQEFEIKKFYNLVFIDADHSFINVYTDIYKFINNSEVIVGDDFVPWWPDVVKAVNRFRMTSQRTLISLKESNLWMLVPDNQHWKECIKQLI